MNGASDKIVFGIRLQIANQKFNATFITRTWLKSSGPNRIVAQVRSLTKLETRVFFLKFILIDAGFEYTNPMYSQELYYYICDGNNQLFVFFLRFSFLSLSSISISLTCGVYGIFASLSVKKHMHCVIHCSYLRRFSTSLKNRC